MEAVREGDPAMATKCLDLCQALVSQGKAFTFSLTHTGTSFTFSLDTRGEEKVESPSLRSPPARNKSQPQHTQEKCQEKKGVPEKEKPISCQESWIHCYATCSPWILEELPLNQHQPAWGQTDQEIQVRYPPVRWFGGRK